MVDFESMNKKLQQVNQLLMAKKAKMALDKLQYLVRQKIFLPEEMWRVYQRFGDCYFYLLDMEKAAEYYWQSVTSAQGMPLAKQKEIYSNYLFILHYLSHITDKELAEKHFTYQQLCTDELKYTFDGRKHKKIRIGYLADKFCLNVVSIFAMQLMTSYDRENFEVHLYPLWSAEDALTDTLKENVTGWHTFDDNADVRKVAAQIYHDEIDILFDLTVHTIGGKTVQVMSLKPAPVQMAGIGYMSTSGITAIDYFLTDKYVDPPGEHEAQFSEQLLRLPHSHFCYTPLERSLQRKTEYKLHTPVVFGSFNNIAKITPEMLAIWLEILKRVPGAKLLIKNSSRRVDDFSRIEKTMKRLGYTREQYMLEQSTYNYMDRYMDVDIALDTYPYGGGASTCDALFCGVPLITLCGTRHGTRFGYSILENAGVGELVAKSINEYVEKAAGLAMNNGRLQQYHTELAQKMRNSSLMNAREYVDDVETIYRQIYETYQQKSVSRQE